MITKNKRNTPLHVLALLAMSVSPLCAQDKPATPPEQQAAKAADLPALSRDARLLTGELANGLKYIIRPTKEPAGRASIRLYVEVGSLHEEPENSGISHFLEHMVFNGSRNFKRGELIPTMQKLGLGFGGDANAYTSLLHTVYMLDLPNLQEKTVHFAFTIMRDFADGATLEADAIDHERGIVISELKSRDSASYRAMIEMLGQITEGTRVAQYLPIGRENVIRNAPYEVVRNYYKNHYVPGRMTVVVVGDFQPEVAKNWVEQYFSSMTPAEPTPAPPLGELKTDVAGEKLIPNPEQANISLQATVVKPYVFKEDTLEQRLEDYPLELATGMLNRRLRRLTKQENCPFIAAQVNREEVFRAADTFGINLSATPQHWQEALSAVMAQVRQATTYGFSEQEMAEATDALLSNLKQACETWETTPAPTIAKRLISSISERSTFTDPTEDLRIAQLALQRLKADPDACRRALAEAMADAPKARLTASGTLPDGLSAPALRSAYEQTLSAEVSKPAEEKPLTFAYDTIGVPGTITHRETMEDLGTTCITLSNNVRVTLKPIHFRKGSISVTAAVDGGQLCIPRNCPGLATMLTAVMQRGGLQEHSMDELERLMASKQVSLNFSQRPTRYIFSGNTNAEDLEMQCKLLAAAILHPGFRPEGEILLRRRLNGQYKQLTTTPDGAFAMQMPRALFGEDARFVIPKQEEVEAVSLSTVRDMVESTINKAAVEVSIVGDFDVEEALPVLARTFGAMPERNKEFCALPKDAEARNVSFRPWGQREYLRYPTELDKTVVAHVRPAGDGRDQKRSRRLSVLASIVREKLFDGLRAAMGESYSPRVQVQTNSELKDAAYIITSSAGVKANRAKVSAAMESICRSIGRGEISREDFDCAFRPYYAQVLKSITSPEFWETSLVKLQSEPDRRELIRDLKEDVRSITYEEIRDLGIEIFGTDTVNHYYVVPEDYDAEEVVETEDNSSGSAPALPQADLSSLNTPATGEYAVITTRSTAARNGWKDVAVKLRSKYKNATLTTREDLSEEGILRSLNNHEKLTGVRPRYVAFVLHPDEISREVVNHIHRATRRVDDDPYGDCMWGIVTGYSAEDAMRIAEAKEPLVIRRLLSTTNIHPARFEHSYCITDWEGFPILEQSGYTEPTKTTFTPDSPEGQYVIENGVQDKFAQQLSSQRPQLIVTSSHATPFNLEMPFSKGLIFPANNRFYLISCKQFPAFTSALSPAMEGKTEALQCLAQTMQLPSIAPDSTPRVWLASGNCLIGDAHNTNQSMVITALSAYHCNQFVGYTVPSWYGEAGWGTLSLFMGNTDNTTLAEAFFLNNQFILNKTMKISPKLLSVHFNEPKIGNELHRDMLAAGIADMRYATKDIYGLVHDRDTLAFYGDPGWAALVDNSHEHAPLRIEWKSDACFTLTANSDYSGRAAVWFPRADIGQKASGCDLPEAVFTNDFILIPELILKKGERIEVHLTPAQPAA